MLNELVKKIASETRLNEEDIVRRIEEKKDELSGIISEEAAAYMVAKELGISLLKKNLMISELKPGMKSVDITAKVVGISEREFSTDKASGRVANVFLADESGTVRMSLWNEEIDRYELRKGDIIHIRGYVRPDHTGEPELRVGVYGSIEKSDENIIIDSERRATISGLLLKPSAAEIRAAIVQIFEGNIFYEICPKCGSRIKKESNFMCEDHGNVDPQFAMVLSGILDDGTASIRAVFFGENAEKLLGINAGEARDLFKTKGARTVLEKIELGTEFIFSGKIRMNRLFERPEFIINDVREIDVREEIEMLMK